MDYTDEVYAQKEPVSDERVHGFFSTRGAFLVLKSFFCETSFFPDQFGKWERSKVSLSILFTLYDLHERFPSRSMSSLCEFHHTAL